MIESNEQCVNPNWILHYYCNLLETPIGPEFVIVVIFPYSICFKTIICRKTAKHFYFFFLADRYKETSKQVSWKPSSQLSFTVGENTLSTNSRIGGKIRVGSSRSGIDRLKRIGSFRRYQTTAEKVCISFKGIKQCVFLGNNIKCYDLL